MKKVLLVMAGMILLAGAIAIAWPQPAELRHPYPHPKVGVQTLIKAPAGQQRLLTIEGATDITYMRPYIQAFQRDHPNVSVQYVDMLTSELLTHATAACAQQDAQPDLYISISTDHLVELANAACGRAVPKSVTSQMPAPTQWRREVFGFSVEPAVFVYDRRTFALDAVPRSRLALIDSLRADPAAWRHRIGTYDIEQSNAGYNYASFDARQAATYGRLIESFGRSRVRTYCCSNDMVDAVARGEIRLAYNVQLSYAYAGQRKNKVLGVVLPSDYQTIQTRSIMVSRDARNPVDGTAFVQTVASSAGHAIAQAQILPPSGGIVLGSLSPIERARQEVVGVSLLSLRDAARRRTFIDEWRRAIYPPQE